MVNYFQIVIVLIDLYSKYIIGILQTGFLCTTLFEEVIINQLSRAIIRMVFKL
jgi:hypothetical protein